MKRPVANDLPLAIELHFFDQGLEIILHIPSILVRVNSKIAELAALATKWNVQVKSERCPQLGRAIQSLLSLRQKVRLPKGEGRVVGHEIVAQARFLLSGFHGWH